MALLSVSTALAAVHSESEDPITGFLTHDWASVGGWSLFVGLGLLIIVAFITERLVPGARVRRLEDASQKLAESNRVLLEQNGKLINANEITKHFFEETVPKRRRYDENV